MDELIKRLEMVIATGVPDKNGQHPISAEAVLGVVKQLQTAEVGTDLAQLGTDCISRAEAIEVVQNRHMMLSKEKVLLINDLEKLPSAELERPKGRWIPVDSYSAFGGDEATWMAHGNPVAFYYCSECKEHAYAGENGEDILSNFCPNCGADMRGKKK